MKKIYLILLALGLMAGLFGCTSSPVTPEPTPPVSQSPTATVPAETDSPAPEVSPSPEGSEPVETPPTAFTAPAGTTLCGVDLSGMNREEALTALADTANNHQLTFIVGQTSLSIIGQSVELAPLEFTFDSYWQALEQGNELPTVSFTLNPYTLESLLSNSLESPAANASVVYSREQEKFVITAGKNGVDYDIPAIADRVGAALSTLASSGSMDTAGREVVPTVAADDPRLTAAAEKANSYLDVVVVYTFTTENGGTVNETFLRNTVAPMIQIGSNYSVSINRSVVESQVAAVAKRHSSSYTANFVSTGGQTLSYMVTYYNRQVDVAAMTEDLYNCLINGVSGHRTAPYLSAGQTALPFGGSYVEIDLTAQTLWVYKNGQCVVTTPIVSGCVAEGNSTPTGVFSIYKKAEDAWLKGPTWLDHVDYWIPFYGAYGLHDASWRNEFGGDIYIHEGSHGCPNLPVEIAGQVYHNVSVGTPVVIYGGLKEAVDLTQEIYVGQTSYSFSDTSFMLDYSLKYDGAAVTFTSDNPNVVTVAADGTVTIHGMGTANITITAAAFTHHTAASMTVQITVSCPSDSHSYGEWGQTIIPNCEETGYQFRTCSVCGKVESQEVPAAGHSFGVWIQTAAPDCENPGSEESVCSVCGHVETREVPATGHHFVPGFYVCTNGCGTANPDGSRPGWR